MSEIEIICDGGGYWIRTPSIIIDGPFDSYEDAKKVLDEIEVDK